MNLEQHECRLQIAHELGYRFSESFVLPPAVNGSPVNFWNGVRTSTSPLPYCDLRTLPDWTVDMDAAWELAEEMCASGLDCLLESLAEDHWLARFWNEASILQETASTAQAAICKVWLKWRLETKTQNAI